MLVQVHHKDGRHESEKVSGERHVEIKVGLSLQTVVETKEQSDKDTRDDYIAQTKHGKVASVQTLLQQILREHHCNR